MKEVLNRPSEMFLKGREVKETKTEFRFPRTRKSIDVNQAVNCKIKVEKKSTIEQEKIFEQFYPEKEKCRHNKVKHY